MPLVAMVLGVLLIQKISERWFRFLFLACVVMNAIYMIPVSVILENGGMRFIYSIYGTSGKGVAEGMKLIESVKSLCLFLVYLSLDVRFFILKEKRIMKE